MSKRVIDILEIRKAAKAGEIKFFEKRNRIYVEDVQTGEVMMVGVIDDDDLYG